MRYVIRVYFSLIFAVILLLGMALPASAAIAAPNILTIDSIEVYRDALGDEDSQLMLVRFNADYTANTTIYDITESLLFVLKDNTGAIVKTASAYAYFNDGWDNGIIAMEFQPTSPLTWSGAYTLYLDGVPTIDWYGGSPPSTNSNVITWLDEGSVSAVQDRLTTRLRYIAEKLETDWGIDLIESTSAGKVLTEYGEDYFTNSISGLRNICPDLFYQSMQAVEYEHDILITDLLSSGADTAVLINNTDYCAQTFAPSEAYSITGMNMICYRVGNPATLTVSLRATAVGLPSGADLVLGTYDTSTIGTSTNGTWINVAFTSDYALTAGVTYALVARTSAAGVGNQLQWLADTGNGYANGEECTFVAAVWAAVPANDLLFEVEARNAITQGLAHRIEDRLVGTQFDFTNWSNTWGLSRIWWSTIFWLGISAVVMVAAAFGSNAWDCSMVVLALMISYGWRGGWVDTIAFALIFAFLSIGVVYAIFWKKA